MNFFASDNTFYCAVKEFSQLKPSPDSTEETLFHNSEVDASELLENRDEMFLY